MNIKPIYLIFVLSFWCGVFCQAQCLNENEQQRIYYLSTVDEAITSRLWALENAKEEILVSYFIIEDDGFGLLFLQKLIRLKQQNPKLKVKILVDASANGISQNIMYFLTQQGIEIKEYHPLPKFWLPLSHASFSNFVKAIKNINLRMHDKLLIVDRKMLISGGRNIEKSYFGLDKKNFHDLDVFILSKALSKKAANYFETLWDSHHVQARCPAIDHSKSGNYKKDVAKLEGLDNFIKYHPDYDRYNTPEIDFYQEGIQVKSLDFLHSYSSSEKKFDPIFLSSQLYKMALDVKREMIIETPYLLYTDRFFELISLLRGKNVRISFITNSFCSTDVMGIAAAYDLRKKKLLELGVEIYEYDQNNYLHSKSAIFDDDIAWVGSYNMDYRSAYINTETVFFFKGKEAVRQLRQIMLQDKANAKKVYLENGKVRGGHYDCEKKIWELLLYTLFKPLSRIRMIYYLL